MSPTRAGLKAVLTVTLCLASPVLPAHQFAPALLELREVDAERVSVRWREPAVRVQGSRLRPVLPPNCEGIGNPRVSQVGTAVETGWELACRGGLGGNTVGVEGIASSRADVLLRVVHDEGDIVNRVLTAAEPAYSVGAGQTRLGVFRDYSRLGVGHILFGWDHLAFVLGLLLLVGWGRRLLWTITAFTLGHSVTLAAAVLGFISAPTRLIEALIAASIYILAVEIFRRRNGIASLLGNAPWLAALGFGLLHGFGFAGALADVGLPSADIPLALLAFNAGIEVGQLLFVGVALGVMALLRQLPRMPDWAVQAPAFGIGSLGVFWFIERLGATLTSAGG